MKFTLGLSTCPNDTFAFHAILERKVDLRGLDLDIRFMDVQQLNEALASNRLTFSKASFHAALHLADHYGVLPAGAAVGFGVGPLVLSGREGITPGPSSRVLCPGAWTTATLLFQCFYPSARGVHHCTFSEIMPALGRGEADFGVVIHEGRFTYERNGLVLTADLGNEWEARTQLPLPLGGILARRDLPKDIIRAIRGVVRDSVEYALSHRNETLVTMQRFAQELDPDVIWSHVDLYVNDLTTDLGEVGRRAIRELELLARRAEVMRPETSSLSILDS